MYEGLIKALSACRRPALYEPGDAPFWDDPYISTQLLKYHLDPSIEAASRPPDCIDAHVENLVSSGVIKPGDRLLDLGCGPGLYDVRLAEKGVRVTGVDISAHSLSYATEQARKAGLDITFRRLDFRVLDYEGEFDAVIQTYGELNTFPDEVRDALLGRVRAALKPGGRLIFDVSTRQLRKRAGATNRWYQADGGLWRRGQHIVLEEGIDYPDEDVFCDQFTIIDGSGVSLYRFWFHDYNLDTLRDVLRKNGFDIEHVWNDLDGTPFSGGGEWLAAVAIKAG